MSFDTFLAFIAFTLTAGLTPGPNNMMLMASGVNYGFRRTLPHMAGVIGGFTLMTLLLGLGLGQLFTAYPAAHTVLKVAGGTYLLFLAWKVATAARVEEGEIAAGAPMTFVQAVLFQWVNIKAWFMGITALATYTVATRYAAGVAIIVAVFFLNSIFTSILWTLFGTGLRHILADPRYYRWINRGLGLALVLSLWPMLKH